MTFFLIFDCLCICFHFRFHFYTPPFFFHPAKDFGDPLSPFVRVCVCACVGVRVCVSVLMAEL